MNPKVDVSDGVLQGLRVIDIGDEHFWFGMRIYKFDEDGKLDTSAWFSNEMLDGDHRDAEVF